MQTKPLLRDLLTDRLRTFILEKRADVPVRISPERELAEKLGVSRISVRKAIKNLVNEGLLVQKQGSGTYIMPIAKARSLRVLLAKDIKQNDPFFNEFLAELTHYCTEGSIQLQIIREATQNGIGHDQSPLVLVGLLEDATIETIRHITGPIVSTQFYPDFLDISQLLFDDSRIGWEAAELLYKYDHRRVVHLSGPDAYPSAHKRTEGFLEGAARRKMEVQTLQGKMNWRSGYELGTSVVDFLKDSHAPSAVFASNDWMALGLMHRLAEDRIKVPDELSIIGCDDIHMSGEISPGLATFKWDINLVIQELFSILDAESAAGPRSQKRVLLPARFIIRESLDRAKTV